MTGKSDSDITKQQFPEQDKAMIAGDEPAPLWLSKAVYFFRLGLTFFLMLTCASFLWGCSGTSATSWQNATHLFSREQVGAMVAEHSSLASVSDEQIDRVLVAAIQNVVAVNFNLPELCGQTTCLYALYEASDHPKALFRNYLKPNLPPTIPIIVAANQSLNNHPCLYLYQENAPTLKRYTLCDTGGKYEVTNQIDRVVKD